MARCPLKAPQATLSLCNKIEEGVLAARPLRQHPGELQGISAGKLLQDLAGPGVPDGGDGKSARRIHIQLQHPAVARKMIVYTADRGLQLLRAGLADG